MQVGQGGHGSYIFLEGRFLNDMRQAGSHDYAAPVMELCRQQNVRPAYFDTRRGAHVLRQLNLTTGRAGSPAAAAAAAAGGGVAEAATAGAGATAGTSLQHQQPQQPQQPAVRPGRMEATTFGELSARLSNWPCYLFCHLGCCEHLLQVRESRDTALGHTAALIRTAVLCTSAAQYRIAAQCWVARLADGWVGLPCSQTGSAAA